ncbi:MAG: monofunctional biosynthetic peptidoglycan transglycosylase [Bacteroidia bacterium]
MLKRIWRIFLKIVLWFFILSITTVIIYRFVPPPITPLMIQRCLEQAFDKKKKVTLNKDWVSLDKISPSLPLAVITAEDQKFAEHFGFDIEAIQKAQKYNDRHKGKRVKGASTISQQTAKNVFLFPSRSWVRKGFEVYFTFLIEVFWSKKRIIEIYLNEIEMGPGIYGAEAAAQHYFGKPAKKLTNSESALIAACLPNPIRWSPAKPTVYIKKKQGWILHHMRYIDLKEL